MAYQSYGSCMQQAGARRFMPLFGLRLLKSYENLYMPKGEEGSDEFLTKFRWKALPTKPVWFSQRKRPSRPAYLPERRKHSVLKCAKQQTPLAEACLSNCTVILRYNSPRKKISTAQR